MNVREADILSRFMLRHFSAGISNMVIVGWIGEEYVEVVSKWEMFFFFFEDIYDESVNIWVSLKKNIKVY